MALRYPSSIPAYFSLHLRQNSLYTLGPSLLAVGGKRPIRDPANQATQLQEIDYSEGRSPGGDYHKGIFPGDIGPLGRNRTQFPGVIMVVDAILAPYVPIGYQQVSLPV